MADNSENNLLASLSDAMVRAVEKADASTVMVNARRRFPASGISYSNDLILTANHVVEREEDISIGFADGNQASARLAGRDPSSDLALLRLESRTAVSAERAVADARVGQFVFALGRPTLEGIQASQGVVSAIGGPLRFERGGVLEKYLQTDAVPYPGFSGGPLIDADGRIVGVNTSGFAPGNSLAIPVSLAWSVAEALKQHGKIKRGYLGIRSQPVDLSAAVQSRLGRTQATGLLLISVESDSQAAQGGLMVGDILVGINGSPVEDHDHLLGSLGGETVGKPVAIEVIRGGEPRSVTVTVGERS